MLPCAGGLFDQYMDVLEAFVYLDAVERNTQKADSANMLRAMLGITHGF